VGLRGYAQRDPLREYQSESFELFEAMLTKLRQDVGMHLAHVEVAQQPPSLPSAPQGMHEEHLDPLTGENEVAEDSTFGKVSRNAPCPCGSGKKFKQCHGKLG